MQIDAEAAAGIGILSSVASGLVGYGIMREKVRRTEKDLEDLRRDQKDFVTQKHFDTVLEPLKTAVVVIQKDIKEILRAVSEGLHRHGH